MLRCRLADLYIFDEGTTVSLFALLLEGSPGVGDALFGGTLGVVRRAEPFPFGAVGKKEGEISF